MNFRFMRTILFFDLPVLTSKDKKAYRHFIKDIKKLGFYRIQKSVFAKLTIDPQLIEGLETKIRSILPNDGNIAILTITEKQFSNIKYLLGDSTSEVLSTDERNIEI